MPARGSSRGIGIGGGGFGRRPTVVPLQRSSSSAGGDTSEPKRESVPWYNDISRRQRWFLCVKSYNSECRGDHALYSPDSKFCQTILETMADCPQDLQDMHNIPPLLNPNVKHLKPPLKVDLPTPCEMWKSLLKECAETNAHYDERWRCVPYEDLVEDLCRPKP